MRPHRCAQITAAPRAEVGEVPRKIGAELRPSVLRVTVPAVGDKMIAAVLEEEATLFRGQHEVIDSTPFARGVNDCGCPSARRTRNLSGPSSPAPRCSGGAMGSANRLPT